VGDDFGIRLNGLLGFGLCVTAAVIFTRFKENSRKAAESAKEKRKGIN
jgi:hypothetical protein